MEVVPFGFDFSSLEDFSLDFDFGFDLDLEVSLDELSIGMLGQYNVWVAKSM